jgi:hypothetical protein
MRLGRRSAQAFTLPRLVSSIVVEISGDSATADLSDPVAAGSTYHTCAR